MKKKKLKSPYWRLDEKAFWPSLRADIRNTGRAPNWQDKIFLKNIKFPDKPWAFKTGKAITCAPVIGADGTIYLGSADTYFYAINPDGSLKWKLKTNNVIDDAAVIARRTDPETREEKDYVFFPGADGFARKVDCQTGKVIGAFEATDHYIDEKFMGVPKCNWFESDFTFSGTGRLLAPCDDFAFYQIDPETMKRAAPEFMTRNQIWSGSPTGFAPEGDHYFGCLDTYFRSVDDNGKLRWEYPIYGMAGASPTILNDGSVVIGSGNNNIYCFRSEKDLPDDQRVKWRFHTKSDVWSSATISHDGSTVIVSSSDGNVYALDAETGKLKWTFPTLGPNRCGCVLDENDNVYIASGDGKIYKLSGKDGSRIWSFDCHLFNASEEFDELDRYHFVPSSIALSPGGIYAPNQNGNLYYIPFSYMESKKAHQDLRCNFNPNTDWPEEGIYIVRVSPGGHPILDELNKIEKGKYEIKAEQPLRRSDTLFFRLVGIIEGQMQDVRIENVQVKSDIEFKMHIQISTDARYINIVPMEFLQPGKTYTLQITGNYIIPKKYGWRSVRLDRYWRGKKAEGKFDTNFIFTTAHSTPIKSKNEPLIQIGNADAQKPGDIFVLRNIFPWQEALIMNLSIIAMDDVYLIASPIYHDPNKRRYIFWCMMGEKITGIERDSDPHPATYKVIAQPSSTPFRFPLDLTYDDDGTFSIFASGFRLDWAGVGMPFKLLKISGQFNERIELKSGATAYFETPVTDIPLFGPILDLMNVKNKDNNFMTAGTYRLEKAKGPAINPVKAKVESVELLKNVIKVHFQEKHRVSIKEHFVSVILINTETAESIKQDYQSNISFIEDSKGNLEMIIQKLEENITKYLFNKNKCLLIVLVDTTPVYKQML